MSSAFISGCERAIWITSKSESFRNVVESKVGPDLRAIAARPDEKTRAKAFRRQLKQRLSRLTLYKTEPADIVYFGKTINNRKEFNFLANLLDEFEVQCTHRMFLDDFSSSKSSCKLYSSLANEIIEEAGNFAAREGIGSAHLWQLLQYAATFLNIRASYEIAKDSLPRIGVVANDHSPSQVAFKAVMDEFNVPVVYLQHAEISKSFPPLEYFISILRNEISQETYVQAGQVEGSVFILARQPMGSRFSEVPDALLAQSTHAIVGIYPTSRFDPQKVSAAAQALAGNPSVDDFFVKLHPNSGTKVDDELSARLRVRADIPTTQHIALVGNSSVATDLLARGIPVFQLFELDEIQPDYYGFVSSGITPETSFKAIADGPFWSNAFYDRTWLIRSAKFDPAVAGGQEEARRAVADAIAGQIAKLRPATPSSRLQPPRTVKSPSRSTLNRVVVKTIEPIVRKVSARFPREMNRLALIISEALKGQARASNSSAEASPISTLMNEASDRLALARTLLETATNADVPINLARWFEASWAARDSQAFDLVRSVAENISTEKHLWLRLIAHETMAMPLSAQAASNLIQELDEIESPNVRKIYEKLAMRVLIRNDHLGQFSRLIDQSPVHSLGSLGGNLKLQVAKQLFNNDRHTDDRLKHEFLKGLSAYERMKLDASGLSETAANVSHKTLEANFISLTHPQLSREFSRSIVPAYSALRSKMKYMDVRTDSSQRNLLASTIADAVRRHRPFSLIRMGDGEAYLVPEDVGPFTASDRRMRERHWWNCELSDDLSRDLRTRALDALRSADIVGIPSIHRFFRDYSDNSRQLFASTANRGIATSVLGAASILSDTVALTEDRVHHLVFDSASLLTLLPVAKRVVIVSSIRAEILKESLGPYCRSLDVVQIPTHAKTKHNPAFVSWDEPLPFVIGNVDSQLRALVEPGDLVLVSAGIAGKSLIATAKKMKAIGLDLGGQLEPLVGIPSGGIF